MPMVCRNSHVPSWMELIPLTVTIGKSRTEGKKKATLREAEKTALLREQLYALNFKLKGK